MSLAQIQEFLEKSAIDSATSSSPDHWILAQQAEWVDIQRATEACQADALWDAISKYPLQLDDSANHLLDEDALAFFELLLASQAPDVFAHNEWIVRVTAQPVEWIPIAMAHVS
ncbi:hypothetical protein H310_10057 [Aphanomyces invadans]|uniref:Uncharacterized protein n=1 Tax=Aphanomyces invadans TaxID=157072 RepID=A0A024TRF8_9STRA|nr:hypothetical protein H310_10057 [Aphanomyces invadans]ETV96740.1 hypothetical protein H310_10057 [Aphanomyces invadans]|eukprot:XP_008874517.1 hypothetical protein H310_10057 [Aphanomyces invadans]